ncbi:leucine--tRNA ligase [Terrimonas sp. NA20]|uniref:Leucine--tRNA ligase n=1 Tax=Terrimonas ginsenosidimutans TaxID=2908004 RepID=A0ABS9KQF0_9BACT|nr:leucine--tRNA ligase [Terrimonas ginsenosidimutans]MCG2614547.1 leucine--tRNA ligase [Terrimonas ginsenosidimutans]
MEYNFRDIEKKWQQQWKDSHAYRVLNESSKPKYYVLDMFPYPSGAGLHVGHPLGYIASDIYSRYKRLKGFNVLHPMGFDAFGLPAEQYALDTGQHPAVTTRNNIATFKSQLNNIGFCYDWEREVNTSEANYYKWTQWIFLQLFDSFFNRLTGRAERISALVAAFEKEGNKSYPSPGETTLRFTADQWENFDEAQKMNVLMGYRLSYCGYGEVNWCEALGTVLANDEVVNGVSERGGYPVVKKKLRQWYLRITEYADRLLQGLETVDFSDAMKEMQTNWIGKSSGAEIDFELEVNEKKTASKLRVYTTRPDTIFGVDFMVIAPEHELVDQITTQEQLSAVEEYITYVKSRSERERMAEKKISGVFTGAFAINPFDGKKIPVWISEYVLAGYGTGAIMAVPCGDERDHKFAKHFNIPVTNIIGDHYKGEEANPTKEAILENSDFLNGLVMKDAIEVAIKEIESKGIGIRKTNFKMRDAAFSRQRYWGEPFPVKWIDGVAYPLSEKELPLELPHVDSYKPGPEGEGPLANIPAWTSQHLETNTMPGYAGSSWYFLRYMDPANTTEFCSRKASDYWGQVDIYIGGTEHAVGHLLYSRMWTKAMYDLGYIGHDEPFKRLINQGMIQGSSRFVYRINGTNKFVSKGLLNEDGSYGKNKDKIDVIHADVNIVDGLELDTEAFREWRDDYRDAEFELEDGKYICGAEVEKMSKSKYNTVNPDDLVQKYGADTFRMYEMFLGPVEMSKPWDTKGIEGVHRFLKKLWRLFYDELKGKVWTDEQATDDELKVLHKAIKQIEEATERFSFNTGVSGFMIAVNELNDLKCTKKEVLQPLLVLLTPYAPHVAEELWQLLGNEGSILNAPYPVFEEKYVKESSKEYPVSINGKLRTTMNISLDATSEEVEKMALANEIVQKWLEGKAPKRIIFVKGKMVNVVI